MEFWQTTLMLWTHTVGYNRRARSRKFCKQSNANNKIIIRELQNILFVQYFNITTVMPNLPLIRNI